MVNNPSGHDPKGAGPSASAAPVDWASSLDSSYGMNRFGETIKYDELAGSQAAREKSDSGSVGDNAFPAKIGRYEIRNVLGKGSFGAVFLGFDRQLDRQVAVKVPHLRGSDQDKEIEVKFLDEARQLAKLSHPGIVAVHDVGVDEACCYIVADYLEGNDLNDWLLAHQPNWIESAEIVAAIADALAHAHAMSTVHRDVKPENVIMVNRPEGLQPVLVDFGLALSAATMGGQHRGMIAGTPNYMSPEQALGESHRVDGRTDIFALGVILYRMLCGRLPFTSRKLSELLHQVIHDDPQPPRQLVNHLPRELEQICLKAIAKQIGARYTTAADMAEDLRRVVMSHQSATVEAVPAAPVHEQPTSELPSSVRRAREAERRQVTVLCCGCEFFESEKFLEFELEDQHELLREYRWICDEAVSQFGGTMVESTSQRLLVCFGFPVAYEDSADRAIRSGLQILRGVEQLDRQRSTQIAPQVAVHTGPVVAEQTVDDSRGSMSETLSIVGEARNVATRLEAIAEPNTLVISDATHLLVRGLFVCESRGDHKVRGAPKPVEVFEVTEESEARSRLELIEPTDLTPLVGRDTELSILRDRWEQAAEGMGQVVLLIGDAGLGKSRLVREIKEHVVLADPEAAIVELRCSPYYQNSGLYPATDLFERLLGFGRETSPAEKLDKLVAHLDEYGLGRKQVVPLFASLLSVPLDKRVPPLESPPQRLKELTQQALLDWLRAFAAKQPVLFIVEDLHWVDPSTLELLGLLVDEGFHQSVLSIMTFRPEFETPWSSKAHQTQVALNRLTKRQVGEMMKQQTGLRTLADDLIAQVVERTDGVPLFVEEFTKVIQESDSLQDVDGSVHLSSSFNLDAIPSSLQDLLVSKLDRMESLHDVAQLGATIGREFSYELLHSVSDLDEPTLRSELDKLVKAEVLFQKGRPPDCNYIFKHALIQDAAYQSLLKKKRRQFHGGIAEALESSSAETAETQPELIAQHLTEAGEAAKSIGYWLKAGQRDQARCANTEAIVHLTKGLEQVGQLDESPERDQQELGFQLALNSALMAAKGYSTPEVEGVLSRARELCERIGQGAPLFPVMWGMWGWRFIREEMDACTDLSDEMMQFIAGSEDKGLLCEAHFIPALTHYYRGDFARSLQHAQTSLENFDLEQTQFYAQFTNHNSGVIMHGYVAMTTWALGLLDRVTPAIEASDQLAEQLEHPFTTVTGLYLTGFVYLQMREGEQAVRRGERLIRIAKDFGFPLYVGIGKCLLGGGLFELGEYDGAIQELREGIAIEEATGAAVKLTWYYAYLAHALWKTGQQPEAWRQLETAFELMNRHKAPWIESTLLRLKGEFLATTAEGQPADAESCLTSAVEVARQQGAKSFQLRASISLSRFLGEHGKREQARLAITEINESFSQGPESKDVLVARALLDEYSS